MSLVSEQALKTALAAVLAGPLCLVSSWAWAQHQPASTELASTGQIQEVRGEAWVSHLRGRRPAQAGDAMAVEERLSTHGQGAVSLLFPDGTAIILGPASVLDLKKYQFNPSTGRGTLVAGLQQGTARVLAGQLAQTSPEMFNIFTPSALVNVRSSDFLVEAVPAR